MASPEQEPKVKVPEQAPVREIPDTPEIPEHVERDLGVKPTQSQPASVVDDSGQTVAQAVPGDDKQAISIPADPSSAKQWSDGPADDSKTWLGVFVLRKLKQAIALGKKVIVKK